MLLNYVFLAIASALSVYSFLCIIRIISTWIPAFAYSKAAFILAKICDPYLDLFRGIRCLVFGGFDFSPALGLCLLGAVSSVFKMLSNGGSFSPVLLLTIVVEVFFSIFTAVLIFLIIVFAIRLMLLCGGSGWLNSEASLVEQFDRSISPIAYKIANVFSFGKIFSYKSALIIAMTALIIVLVIIGVFAMVFLKFFIGLA